MKTLDFDGYTLDPKTVNFVGKVEYSNAGNGGHGFLLIINGSSVRVGVTKSQKDALKNREDFIKVWKESLSDNL